MARVGNTTRPTRAAGARIDITGAIRALEGTATAVRQANEDLQIELANAGAEEMKRLIETRGTVRKWNQPMYAKNSPREGSLRDASYPGRVNTGKMRDSVRVRFERGALKAFAAFGWIDNAEPYFFAQEYGTSALGFRKPTGNPGIDNIRGMFALRDARLYVTKNVLPRLIQKYERRIARGVYR